MRELALQRCKQRAAYLGNTTIFFPVSWLTDSLPSVALGPTVLDSAVFNRAVNFFGDILTSFLNSVTTTCVISSFLGHACVTALTDLGPLPCALIRVNAAGLCAANLPLPALSTSNCGLCGDAATWCVLISIGAISFFLTVPNTLPCVLFQLTLSPTL